MNWLLVGAGFCVHLMFFYSIFDIYFTSPLVHGMTPQASTSFSAPARRLILFVADGLRADKLFELDENGKSRAPYLRSIMEHEGAWGVSHTRVPTESRPGHVAIIAGFYEDVSAVAKGWKENPVEFDSVFNESSMTWSWGSPDILPMFAANHDHVYTKTYPANSEDFAGANLSQLDTWVFDNVKEYLQSALSPQSEQLQKEKVILFLHLLGLDTNGHAHRPYSHEYLANIGVVDSGVKDMVNIIEEYYGHDNKTAYILTADHGMTNWAVIVVGSHGAGHPDETLTPLIAWGAGIRRPQQQNTQTYTDNFLKDWELQHVKRTDVNQADICPLMATLVGVPLPVNSVGVLPEDYLSLSPEDKAESVYTNAQQILQMYNVKMQEKQKTTFSSLFVPFGPLTLPEQANRIRRIRSLIQNNHNTDAISESKELIDLALEGLHYYHNYDRFFLGVSILLGFVGWICYVLTLVIQKHTTIAQPRSELDRVDQAFLWSEKGMRMIFSLAGGLIFMLLYVQQLPWTHYLYCLLPVVLWHKVAKRREVLQDLQWYIVDHGYIKKTLLLAVLAIGGLEIIVMSFFYRELLSVGLVTMAMWPIVRKSDNCSKLCTYSWSGACLTLAVFPLLPVVGREANYSLVLCSGFLSLILGTACTVHLLKKNKQFATKLTLLQLVSIIASMCVVYSTSSSISNKEGLPFYNQVTSWTILAVSLVSPLLGSTNIESRLLHIGLAFMSPYLLLSTAHEALFCVLLCVVMYCWLNMEAQLFQQYKMENLYFDHNGGGLLDVTRKLQLADLRIAYFFIFFLIVGFFGTGNIASINSFDPASVMCFLTVFSPFVMGALMLGKILIPFLLVSAAFNAIHVSIRIPTLSLVLLVLLMSDFMAMHFFLLVRDSGSWLDIGTSISHYVIVMSMICFLLLLLAISKILTTTSLTQRNKKQHPL